MGIFSKYRTLFACVFFLTVFAAEASYIASRKSNTWDESAHILAGYAYLKEGMDYLSPLNHPALGRAIQGVFPAALLDLDFNPKVMPEEAKGSDFFPYSIKFLYANKTDGDKVLFLSRLGNIMLGVLLGAFVFKWSRELWGGKGGVFSLFLYALCPNVLAHSSLATTDLPITAFFFISAYYLYRAVKFGPGIKDIAFFSVFFALALTSKHTAFLLLPVILLALIFNLREGRPVQTISRYVLAAFAVYFMIWAVYGFRYHSPSPDYAPLYWDKFSGARFEGVFDILRQWKALPEAYLYGISGVASGISSGKSAFLMGEYSNQGWWYYFLIAFLLKTPVAALFFIAAAVVYMTPDRENRKKALFLILPAAVVFIVMSTQKVNIGLRHILPVYPFLLALAGFAPNIRTESRKAAKALFIMGSAWYIYSNVMIFPHQLAYFNEFAGGPKNGYRYLVDSNLDWGQDLKGLKEHMDRKGIKKIKLAYFGLSDPGLFDIDYDYLPSYVVINPENVQEAVPLKGWFAISATMLQGVYLPNHDFYKAFKDLTPVDTVGYSIFIYHFD